MLLILSWLTSCPGDSVESSTRLIHHVIRLMHALLILRASMRVRTHRDGNVHGGRTKFFPVEASTHLQLFIDYYEVWFSQRGG